MLTIYNGDDLMQLGIDFDGTLIKYRLCFKHGSGDGIIKGEFNSIEEAKNACKSLMRKSIHKSDCKYWIVKVTSTYETVYSEYVD